MEKYVFPEVYQQTKNECGPTTLYMVAKFYGLHYSLQYIKEKCNITQNGTSFSNMKRCAEHIGFRCASLKCTIYDLIYLIPLPTIILWQKKHYIVVFYIEHNFIWTSDPVKGHVKYSYAEFVQNWYIANEKRGFLLAIEPQS